MGCQPLEDLFELFLLGTLPREEYVVVDEHVERGCPNCLERLREASQTVYLFSLMTRQARPDPKQKAQLLRRLRKK